MQPYIIFRNLRCGIARDSRLTTHDSRLKEKLMNKILPLTPSPFPLRGIFASLRSPRLFVSLSLRPFVSSSLRLYVFYSPLIAVIPGNFLPSMYSSIAPPPVDT